MHNETQILMGQHDWWRRVEDETHGVLTSLAHELSDETARVLQYVALLCGALAHDARWDENAITALTASLRERVPYDYGHITTPVAALILTGYHGSTANQGVS